MTQVEKYKKKCKNTFPNSCTHGMNGGRHAASGKAGTVKKNAIRVRIAPAAFIEGRADEAGLGLLARLSPWLTAIYCQKGIIVAIPHGTGESAFAISQIRRFTIR